MEKKAQYRHIEEFKATLATQREDFKKQLEKARKEYPLVALAFSIQEAAIVEMAYPRHWEALSILSSLTETPAPYPDPELGHRMNECYSGLDTCIGQSRGAQQSVAYCWGAFPECLKSAINPHRQP